MLLGLAQLGPGACRYRLDIAFEDGPQVTDRLGCQPSAAHDWVAWAVLAGCAVVVALCVAVVVGVLL